jgi:hypothetical protein
MRSFPHSRVSIWPALAALGLAACAAAPPTDDTASPAAASVSTTGVPAPAAPASAQVAVQPAPIAPAPTLAVVQPATVAPPSSQVTGTVLAQSARLWQVAGTTAPAGSAHLTYYGGPLLQNVKVYQLLWGAPGPGRTFIPEVANGGAAAVYKAYVEGGWLDWISAEYSTALYSIGKGRFAGTVALSLIEPASRGNTLYDSDVQAEIGAQIAAGRLPADPNALFMISFPAEVDVLQSLTAYGRGVGKLPDTCAAGTVDDAGLCYPPCKAGYQGVGPVCWQVCPAGYHDDGLTCRKDGSIIAADTSKCPWYDVCGLTFAQGCSVCPAGYHDDGCTCRIDPIIFGKSSYGRGVGSPLGCHAGLVEDAGLCYPPCADGFTGVGPLCWGHDRFCGGHQGFCGYHSSFLHGVTDVRYAVLADMGPTAACYNDCWTGQPFSDLTKTFSHELVEAVTDPDLNTGWNDLAHGEIGDICNSTQVQLWGPAGAYTVQDEWSNRAAACRY